jgi:hypothetical protein
VCGTCCLCPGVGQSISFFSSPPPPHNLSVILWLSVAQQMWRTVVQKGHQHQNWKRALHCLCPVTSHRQWSSDQSHSRTRSAPCHPHQRTVNCQRSLAVSTNLTDCAYRCLYGEDSVLGNSFVLFCVPVLGHHDTAKFPIHLLCLCNSMGRTTAELISITCYIQELWSNYWHKYGLGHTVALWLWRYATSSKVLGLRPDEIIEFYQFI